MADFNKVILMGHITREIEVRYTPANTAVIDIGVAVNRRWKDKQTGVRKQEVTFVDVTVFGRSAEVVHEYCSKGSLVLVEGRLKLDEWEDKQTQQRRSKLKVIGESVQLMPKGEGREQPRGEQSSQSSDTYQAPEDQIPF